MESMVTGEIPAEISTRIHWLRLPLILGVIAAHAVGPAITLPSTPGWLVFVLTLVSGVWARNSVNLLYIFSGFLFFYSFYPTWQTYRGKLARRMRTLVTPYLFWNLANLLFLVFIQALPATSNFLSGDRLLVSEYTIMNYADAFLGLSGTPVAYPFWFLRDLILMVALSPFFYLLARRWPWLAGGALCLWFLSSNQVVVLSPRSLFFFYLGAAWAIQKPDVQRLDRWRGWIVAAYLLASLAAAGLVAAHPTALNAVMLLGVPAVWVLAGIFKQWHTGAKALARWAPGSFFIFAIHEPLLTIVRKLGYRLIPPAGGWQILSVYLLTIVLTTAGSMLAWKVAMRVFPAFTRLVSGGR
jgi:peptidoglycan/LPS O-acetylase OafA/YrhL